MSDSQVLAADPYARRRVGVLDTEMAYVDTGAGDPVVFLHGNPTSSYLWRNVIPHVEPLARCLAPDLVGMGESARAPGGSYRFVDHARYLDAWFDALTLTSRVTVVGHDWGSALGFHWAHRFPDRVRALVYMEAIVRPVTWDEWPEAARGIFRTMRSPAGEEVVLQKNVFVERILPASVLRGLTAEEMAVYRTPFVEPGESRRPTLTWPRQIPLAGEPADVVAIVDDYARWLAQSPVPKLFVDAEPGSILVGAQREFCRRWPNQREVTVRGSHFVQEDSPAEIGRAIAASSATSRDEQTVRGQGRRARALAAEPVRIVSAVTVRAFRWAPGERERRQTYEVTAGADTTVLDALVEIQRGQDQTLAFRYACRVGMCGSCAMVVNGRERWACRTRLAALGSDVVDVRPLYHFPLLRDLVVDMSPFHQRLRDVGAALVPRENAPAYARVAGDSRERREIDEAVECIGCGMCLSACTVVARAPRFPGPAALNRAFTLQRDHRDGAAAERWRALLSDDALARCHGQGNCTVVCPMGLAPSSSIARLRRLAVGRLFGAT